jgi:hypothetical protein
MTLAKSAMVLITYKPGPAATAENYEPWLREKDNPTFNSVSGIHEYSNWKVLAPGGLAFTHFDFLGLESVVDLERVWFSPQLNQFRQEWVARWGYNSVRPGPVSGYAMLCMREGGPICARERFVEINLDPADCNVPEQWEVVEALRKHWAIGVAPFGEPWRKSIAEFNPLGCRVIALTFHAQASKHGNWSARRILAECIAAP